MNVMTAAQKKTTGYDPQPVSQDEAELIVMYRRAKSFGFADIMISINDGRRIKLWLTEKQR